MSLFATPAHYLPHESPMLLLDKVISVTPESVHCQVDVDANGVLAPFLDVHGNLPSWYALELMAQSVGVWSGWQQQQLGNSKIALGMVLGARQLACESDCFPAGASLNIHMELLIQDGRFGSFAGTIEQAQTQVASGRINTFQPGAEELEALFNQGS